MNTITAILAAGVLTLGVSACGSDDDGGGDGGDGGAKSALLGELTADGTEGLDEGCLEDKVNGLSDSDAQFMLDNVDATEAPADASAAVLQFATELFECIDLSDLDIDLSDLDE